MLQIRMGQQLVGLVSLRIRQEAAGHKGLGLPGQDNPMFVGLLQQQQQSQQQGQHANLDICQRGDGSVSQTVYDFPGAGDVLKGFRS